MNNAPTLAQMVHTALDLRGPVGDLDTVDPEYILGMAELIADTVDPGDGRDSDAVKEDVLAMLDGSLRCPTSTTTPSGEPHSIIGCGSNNLSFDGDVWDCDDCGISFGFNDGEVRA